jgi:hypothetical protein
MLSWTNAGIKKTATGSHPGDPLSKKNWQRQAEVAKVSAIYE